MRMEKNINMGIISWSNTKFSKLTLYKMSYWEEWEGRKIASKNAKAVYVYVQAEKYKNWSYLLRTGNHQLKYLSLLLYFYLE